MSPWQTFWSGIAPQHAAALILTALLPGLWWLYRTITPPPATGGTPPLSLMHRWAVAGLAMTGVVHVALPIGHNDNPILNLGFLGAGAAYLWLATRVVRGRSWRLLAALLVVTNLLGYLVVITAGGEEPDQVGIITALDELMVLGIALTGSAQTGSAQTGSAQTGPAHRRLARLASSAATVAAVLIVGLVIWIGSFVAHQHSDLDADLTTAGAAGAAVEVPHHDNGHEHDHAARAQAGVIMRSLSSHHPTAEQVRAAGELAKSTEAAIARFADINVALASGYRPTGPLAGTEVHLENKTFATDAYVLDPAHPQALVYVVAEGKAALLGAVFRMPEAGRPGPEPGAAITRWHAHNICLSPLPPGAGLVSPFGGCPALSVAATMPEMMHVWTAGNPGGPYAESVDPQWARAYNAEHGTPVTSGRS